MANEYRPVGERWQADADETRHMVKSLLMNRGMTDAEAEAELNQPKEPLVPYSKEDIADVNRRIAKIREEWETDR